MPSFSLPGTSIGTEEAERYLIARAGGSSRAKAAGELLALGMGEGYPKAVERMLEVAIARGKAIFAGDQALSGLGWIEALCGAVTRPLFAVNKHALDHGVNALCFCRSSVLLFGRDHRVGQISHNPGSTSGGQLFIDSW